MKHSFRIPPERPTWWPENEPWPPPVGHFRRHGIRDPFFIRFGCLIPFFFLFTGVLCAIVGATAGMRFLGAPPPGITPLLGIGLLLGIVFIIWVFVGIIIRRLVGPMGAVMDASDRLAAGDYSARISERGLHDFRKLAHSFNSMSSRLEIYDQQRKRLLADISHELRTPLTVLQGNVEAMLDNVYPRDDEHLQSVLEETRILSRLIDDLRTLSLAETGRLSLRKESQDPQKCLLDVVEAMKSQAMGQNIQLLVEVSQPLPLAEYDEERIRQVLENLISNALRHTATGGVIRTGCRLLPSASSRLEFYVTDNGRGIAPADLPHIFNRYYKSSDSGGTGLGLAIAKQLIEAHGGTIQAESVQGSGTTIRFTLPMHSDQAGVDDPSG
jgi:two-component system, OmpR family, sensor histidine kinase BaeS